MRQTLTLFIIMAVTTLTISCTGCDDMKDAVAGNSSNVDFGQTMRVADSLYSCMRFRDAYDLYKKLLDSEEVETDHEKRLSVLNALSNASELSGNLTEETKWIHQLLDLATQTGNDYYHSLALMAMGQNVFYEGDHEKGIQFVNDAISLMEKSTRNDADHLMYGHLIMLARLYGEMKDYDKALQTNERNLQLTMEGTRWGTAKNQQLIDHRMALAKIAALLARMGLDSSGSQQRAYFQRADSAYAAWKAVQYEGNHTRDYFIVDYMRRRGLYHEAVTIYNDLIQRIRQQGDTLGEMMNTVKWSLADVYHQMGKNEQAVILYEDVLEIQDTLKSRKARNTALELAAIYHDNEQHQIIMQQEAENTRNRFVIILVVAAMIGLLFYAEKEARQKRAISLKNQSLAAQITESLNYKKLYWDEKRAQAMADVPDDLNTLDDSSLFHHISEVIVRERLYLNPNFGRDVIMERFQLTKERVGTIFAKGSEYAKMSSYILQLRLEYAAHVLVHHPERSIVQVAADSGFSSSSYFSTCFRQHFGISPTDYRRDAPDLKSETVV